MEIIDIEIELQQIITKREGMIAENKQREYIGQSMAYGEKDFEELVRAMQGLLDTYNKYYR